MIPPRPVSRIDKRHFHFDDHPLILYSSHNPLDSAVHGRGKALPCRAPRQPAWTDLRPRPWPRALCPRCAPWRRTPRKTRQTPRQPPPAPCQITAQRVEVMPDSDWHAHLLLLRSQVRCQDAGTGHPHKSPAESFPDERTEASPAGRDAQHCVGAGVAASVEPQVRAGRHPVAQPVILPVVAADQHLHAIVQCLAHFRRSAPALK